MVGWHHQLSGHEFEQTLGDSGGQGILACCSPWGRKESDTTEQLNKGRVDSQRAISGQIRKKESLSPDCPPQSLVLAMGAQCEFHSCSHGKRQVEGAVGRNPSSQWWEGSFGIHSALGCWNLLLTRHCPGCQLSQDEKSWMSVLTDKSAG